MKTKIILILLFFASMAYEASAITIVISGGGINHQYRDILVSRKVISCKGNGHNGCPVDFTGTSNFRVAGVPVTDITGYVKKEIASNNKDGSTNFNNFLPVSWKMLDDEYVEITIEADQFDKVDDAK